MATSPSLLFRQVSFLCLAFLVTSVTWAQTTTLGSIPGSPASAVQPSPPTAPSPETLQEPTAQQPATPPSAQAPVAGTSDAVNSVEGDSGTEAGRIARLEKFLTGSRWTGNFTVTGKEDGPLRPESYTIDKAVKNPDGDQWTITARIQYGSYDVTVPMVFDIKWAGETPVMTVDRLAIPLMGTFDARVLIRSGQYAGTWRHDETGGHLFGVIATAEEQAKEKGKATESGQQPDK